MATSKITSTSASTDEPEFWTVLKTVRPTTTAHPFLSAAFMSNRYLLKTYLGMTDEEINECQAYYEKQ